MRNPLFWGTALGVALCSSLVLYGNKYYNLDLNLWLSIVGTMITAVAFGFGTYFVALAIDAYSHVSTIRQSAIEVRAASAKAIETEQDLEEIRAEFKRTSKRVEQEAFSHIESVMAAMIEYVQQLPSKSASQQKAAKKLQEDAACTRARFTCKTSQVADDIVSASLTLANYKDRLALGALNDALKRFAGNEQVVSALAHSIRIIEME